MQDGWSGYTDKGAARKSDGFSQRRGATVAHRGTVPTGPTQARPGQAAFDMVAVEDSASRPDTATGQTERQADGLGGPEL